MLDSPRRFMRLQLPARLRLAAILTVAAVIARTPAAHAAGIALGGSADSVLSATWTLSNGTRVVAQHIPFGYGISMSVSYPGGSDQDPAGRSGLAALLAELQFTAAAGDVPERLRREMSSLRPMGADVHVGKCFTVFTEVASKMQVHGVLHQVATRMRGVQVTPEVLAAALESVRARYHEQFLDLPDLALYNEMGERAAGSDDAAIRRLATIAGLERLTVKDVAPWLAKAFPSRRAVIAIAGNLEGLDLRAALERELSTLAGEAPGPLPPARALHAIGTAVHRPGLGRPVGGFGIIAPALADSSYPAFFLAALIVGAQGNSQWGEPVEPLNSRFQYSVLEEPELVRFYPPLALKDRTPEVIAQSFESTIGRQDNLVVSDDVMANLRFGIGWLIGGPLNEAVINHMRTDGGSLILLSTNMAERELRGGEAFWKKFRAQVERTGVPDLVYWLGYMRDPKLQVRLMFLPVEPRAPGK